MDEFYVDEDLMEVEDIIEEGDFYTTEELENECEDDVISAAEAAWMQGYLEEEGPIEEE